MKGRLVVAGRLVGAGRLVVAGRAGLDWQRSDSLPLPEVTWRGPRGRPAAGVNAPANLQSLPTLLLP